MLDLVLTAKTIWNVIRLRGAPGGQASKVACGQIDLNFIADAKLKIGELKNYGEIPHLFQIFMALEILLESQKIRAKRSSVVIWFSA